MEVLWFGYMEEVVCNGDDLILNPLFNFEPMQGLEYWGDVTMFGSTGNGTCASDNLLGIDMRTSNLLTGRSSR